MCGNSSQLVEVFSPQIDSFLQVSLSLPETHNYGSFVYGRFLLVHSSEYICQVTVSPAGQLVLHSQISTETVTNKYTNTHPVVDAAGGLFYIFQADRCISFSIETGSQVQSFA